MMESVKLDLAARHIEGISRATTGLSQKWWHDLQSTTIPHARFDVTNDKEIEFYFQSHHFLTVYQRESQRAATFGTSIRTCRDPPSPAKVPGVAQYH